jgi:hypothetical protein
VFHRGSALGPPPAHRWATAVGVRPARHGWFDSSHSGRWADAPGGEHPAVRRFITRATPLQRTAIGFPPPGDDYWDCDTLAGVAARYPGIDLDPYRNP